MTSLALQVMEQQGKALAVEMLATALQTTPVAVVVEHQQTAETTQEVKSLAMAGQEQHLP
jgi:hypothetical protein